MDKKPILINTALATLTITSIMIICISFCGSGQNQNIIPNPIPSTNTDIDNLFSNNRLQYMENYFKTELIQRVLPLLNNDPAYSELNGDTLVIGDLHGNLDSLAFCRDEAIRYLQQGKNVLLLGDLVDKHSPNEYDASAECFLFAMMLKQMFPHQVIKVLYQACRGLVLVVQCLSGAEITT